MTTLDLPGSHDMYVTQFPITNAAAIGSQRPIVVVNSAAIALFDERELQTVLGQVLRYRHVPQADPAKFASAFARDFAMASSTPFRKLIDSGAE